MPRTTLHVQPLGNVPDVIKTSHFTVAQVKMEKDDQQAGPGPAPLAQRGTRVHLVHGFICTDLSAVFAKIPLLVEEEGKRRLRCPILTPQRTKITTPRSALGRRPPMLRRRLASK